MSGAEKRAKAFATLKAELVADGKEVKDSYLNMLIEVGVATIKGTLEIVTAPAAA